MLLRDRDLRDIYVDLLIGAREEDSRICIIEADLSKAIKTLDFAKVFPEQFVDVGVAEANMISVAAGMSAMGKIPFTHSFTPFATRRCCDQITLSVSYAKKNVKMVGSDPGVTATLNGGTHMSFEDVAIMRNIPDMVIIEPIDGVQLAKLFPQIIEYYGAVYIRMLRRSFKSIVKEDDEVVLGKALKLEDGKDVAIFASGIMTEQALLAREELEKEGISSSIINIHTIKPLDSQMVIQEGKRCGAVVTAENHSIINGLGSAVCEVLSSSYPVPVIKVGVKDRFGEVGPQEFLMEKYGLTSSEIVKACKQAIEMKK